MSNSNIDSNRFNKNLNEYLTTEEGIQESAKVLPILMGGFINNTEENFSQISQQLLVALNAVNDLVGKAQESEERFSNIENKLGIYNSPQPQATGTINPSQPAQPQGELNELSNLLGQLKQNNSEQN